MKLVTPVEITHAKLQIGYDTPVLLLGSCFTDEIGKRLQAAGFDVLCNPFGTLYNPLSITSCLERAMSGRGMQEEDMVQHEGVWHSWLHHSRFSHPDRETCMAHCNEAIAQTHEFLQRSPLLMVTFGTAWVFYRQGRVVANCHKLPSQQFVRRRLSVQDIMEAWQPVLDRWSGNSLFTVSPIRHMADGAHGNQLSKATLLLAVESLMQDNPQVCYFDSYELLLDELRDYRFYARDMCHPSELAVDIIWERFQQTYMTEDIRRRLLEEEKAYRRSQHRAIINKIID